ncbi:MAG: D-sedoheptulose 7-phosphate isomerase [Candidatus Cloacimonetes bacterium]|nr:D-sedoheptulose 7-phosphate isomerase [Candidatus Cloacimonadota bacterium]MCF7813402.1 D-sedoheptulose 7-phosphate isomerase [Candidatus Cloacimonadota bacterium]MCF7867473.1 D-sedoheptulose 7-phosphate isomerase [Candidatus Cloacimonadota bacterium]MCF7883023.1 D-sedoheptulose 7-phosphate isomerase [Candidatus Cloacimonadota bacterium]
MNSLKEAATHFARFLHETENSETILAASEMIAAAFSKGNKVLICGNGGSSTDAMHFAEECTGRFRKDRQALPAISLTDPSHITCVANDFGFDQIFARGVEAYGNEGDIFIGISTSGNSKNVIEAVKTAKEKGMKTIFLTGKDGGKLSGKCDLEIIAPGETTDRIQEIHICVLHIIIETVERIVFPQNYK